MIYTERELYTKNKEEQIVILNNLGCFIVAPLKSEESRVKKILELQNGAPIIAKPIVVEVKKVEAVKPVIEIKHADFEILEKYENGQCLVRHAGGLLAIRVVK